MFRLGHKSSSRIQTVGNKVMFPSTMGSKLTRNLIVSSKPSESTNINNNVSNHESVAHMPTGLKRNK
jgi:hypothetical protein